MGYSHHPACSPDSPGDLGILLAIGTQISTQERQQLFLFLMAGSCAIQGRKGEERIINHFHAKYFVHKPSL